MRAIQQDKFNAVNKIHDQIKEQKEKENETLKTRMLRVSARQQINFNLI